MNNFLITGASSGIGLSVVNTLNVKDNHLYLVGRDEKKLSSITKKLISDFTIIVCDLEDVESINEALKDLPNRLDGFIHCAGIDSTLPLNKISIEKFDSVFRLNFFSFIAIMKIISSSKKNSDNYWTNVVAVSSIASSRGGIGQTLYSSSKAALESAVLVLTKELLRKKFRINCVSPGLVDTEMTRRWMKQIGIEDINELNTVQLSGIAKPEHISSVIFFLLSSDSNHIFGQNLIVDGGGPTSKFF